MEVQLRKFFTLHFLFCLFFWRQTPEWAEDAGTAGTMIYRQALTLIVRWHLKMDTTGSQQPAHYNRGWPPQKWVSWQRCWRVVNTDAVDVTAATPCSCDHHSLPWPRQWRAPVPQQLGMMYPWMRMPTGTCGVWSVPRSCLPFSATHVKRWVYSHVALDIQGSCTL